MAVMRRMSSRNVFEGEKKVVMEKYSMFVTGESSILGEGAWSLCRRGFCIETCEPVAIKVYKMKGRESSSSLKIQQQKFLRQVQVLLELQAPFTVPSNPRLWSDELARLEPSALFMRLVDYSKDDSGQPNVDVADGLRYIITECGSCSLSDFLKSRRRPVLKPLSKTAIGNIVCSVVRVVAGLHAKGLVHLDLKPENLMLFDSALKLIDVDGCVPIGSIVQVDDSSLSFSPCYCAPEWARFLIDDVSEHPSVVVHDALDVWSVGLVAWELISLEAAMKPVFRSFMGQGHAANLTAFRFLEWLSELKTVTIPDAMKEFDEQFADMLLSQFLVCDQSNRKTLAESLSHPYIVSHMRTAASHDLGVDKVAPSPRLRRFRSEDHSEKALRKGALWKLQAGGDKTDLSAWKLRDVWVSVDGSLCYFSITQDKRLVLLNGNQLLSADIVRLEGSARPHAFHVRLPCDTCASGSHERDTALACESEDELFAWIDSFERARACMMGSIHLGTDLAIDMRNFMLSVRNRRKKLELNTKNEAESYQPLFKGKLKKLISNGRVLCPDSWREREMWITKNGSLVYWSVKDFAELVYYTADDIHHSDLVVLEKGRTCYEWVFQICPTQTEDGIQFSPGTFAAESEEIRNDWVQTLAVFTKAVTPCGRNDC